MKYQNMSSWWRLFHSTPKTRRRFFLLNTTTVKDTSLGSGSSSHIRKGNNPVVLNMCINSMNTCRLYHWTIVNYFHLWQIKMIWFRQRCVNICCVHKWYGKKELQHFLWITPEKTIKKQFRYVILLAKSTRLSSLIETWADEFFQPWQKQSWQKSSEICTSSDIITTFGSLFFQKKKKKLEKNLNFAYLHKNKGKKSKRVIYLELMVSRLFEGCSYLIFQELGRRPIISPVQWLQQRIMSEYLLGLV